MWDIVDARDFLIGCQASGLVVELFNGDIVRAPYLPPFVSLVSRASLPPDKELWFAQKVLALNQQFHESLPGKILLKDTDKSYQKLVLAAGFSDDATLLETFSLYNFNYSNHTL